LEFNVIGERMPSGTTGTVICCSSGVRVPLGYSLTRIAVTDAGTVEVDVVAENAVKAREKALDEAQALRHDNRTPSAQEDLQSRAKKRRKSGIS
jgi:hypothetical protein